MSKILIWVLIIAVVVVGIWWFLKPAPDDVTVPAEPEPVEEAFVATSTFVIRDHPGEVPGKCEIKTDQGTSEAYVNPGGEVTFINESGTDRTLTFGPARKLFDPADLDNGKLTVPAGETVTLQVLEDADAAGKGNPHTFQSCHDDIGPPKIIVCPPGTSGPTC